MPVKRTGMVAGVSSPTRKSIVTPSGARLIERSFTIPPMRMLRSSGMPFLGDVGGGVEESGIVAQAPHAEQHRGEHGEGGKDDQGEPLVLGFHRGHASRLSASASASARRMAVQLHSVTPSVRGWSGRKRR
jgi:hypothetical protein